MTEKALGRIVERLAEAAIRAALGYDVSILVDELAPSGLPREAVEAVVKAAAKAVADYDGVSYRCNICGKGPFTRKGLYLHIKRLHMDQVRETVLQELKAVILTPRTS